MTETTPREADLDLIQRILPHRYPFLLVDKVRDIVPWKSAVGIKCITANEPQFTGHFPGNPVMPGVLIVEAMAQAAGVLGGVSIGAIDRGFTIYFMALDKVKFRRKVVPGDVVEMHVTFLRGGTRVWKFAGRALVDGEVAAEAEFSAMIDQRGPAEPAAAQE